MSIEIISKCGCCGPLCCELINGSYIGSAYRSCYYDTMITFTYESLGLPTKTDIFKNCIKEEGLAHKWILSIYNAGLSSPFYSGDIDEAGNLIGLPYGVNLYCRYGAWVYVNAFCEPITTTTTTITTTTQEP